MMGLKLDSDCFGVFGLGALPGFPYLLHRLFLGRRGVFRLSSRSDALAKTMSLRIATSMMSDLLPRMWPANTWLWGA